MSHSILSRSLHPTIIRFLTRNISISTQLLFTEDGLCLSLTRIRNFISMFPRLFLLVHINYKSFPKLFTSTTWNAINSLIFVRRLKQQFLFRVTPPRVKNELICGFTHLVEMPTIIQPPISYLKYPVVFLLCACKKLNDRPSSSVA